MKAFILLLFVAIGGFYLFGGFDGNYTRTVGKPPEAVALALSDLDITEQPGSPGTDPSRSGGIKPAFRFKRDGNTLTWTVMSGDQVATRMSAFLEPLDDGKKTRITTKVERGDAPDDFVSPAFRSTGLTMGLFAMALESELDELVVGKGWGPQCDKLMEEFTNRNMADVDLHTHSGGMDAIGDVAKTGLRLNAMDGQLKAAGCNPDVQSRTGQAFVPVESRMSEGPARRRDDGVSFAPGKPMIDTNPGRR